jgi:signal peptidase I
MMRSKLRSLLKTCRYWFFVILSGILLAIVLRVFFFAIYSIPTPSMEPAIMSGDQVIVNKMIPGPRIIRNFFSLYKGEKPDIKHLKGTRAIRRNDVLIFNYPYSNWNRLDLDMDVFYAKRCVAIPGDTFYIENGIYRVKNVSEHLGCYEKQEQLSSMNPEAFHPADGRALTWKISFQTIIRHPFGVGLGNFPGAYGETQAAYFAAGKGNETEESVAGNPEYGFNEYLQITVESGIIAFLLFAGIIILALRDRIKNKDWGILGSLTALLVFAGFSYPFSVLPFLIVFVFLLAPNPCSRDDRNSFMSSIFLAVVCLLITACCLWKQYPVCLACKQWKTNRVYYNSGLFKETVEHYRELYPYLNDQISYLFEYAQCLSKSGQPAESNAVLRRAMQISCDPMLYNVMGKNYQDMKQYGQAEAAFVHAAQLVPSRLYPWYLLTKLYNEMGMKDKVNETVAIMLTKEPKVQSPAVNEMREEVKRLKAKN